jgi:hypothetical protein
MASGRFLLAAALLICLRAAPAASRVPDLGPEAQADLKARYVGKACWLRYAIDKNGTVQLSRPKGEVADLRVKEIGVDGLPRGYKVWIEGLQFGDSASNFLTLRDERGKPWRGIRLSIPGYSPEQKRDPDFPRRVVEDYEYAISRIVSMIAEDARIKLYTNLYGEEAAVLIISHMVVPGMSRAAALESWGRPGSTERTILAHGSREVWIYPDPPPTRVVHLEGDRVVAVAD